MSRAIFPASAAQLKAFSRERGVLLRPRGNTVYVMPPYCCDDTDLEAVYDVMAAFLGQSNVELWESGPAPFERHRRQD